MEEWNGTSGGGDVMEGWMGWWSQRVAAAWRVGLFGMDGLGFGSCWTIGGGDSAMRWNLFRGRWCLAVFGVCWRFNVFCVLGVLRAERCI